MKLFGGTTPQEKAISTLIHDTNGVISLSSGWIESAKKHLENNELDKVIESLNFAKSSNKRIKDSIDTYLNKAKTDFI